jgi:hypothetical protein
MGFTLEEFKSALLERKGTTFVTIVAETDPKLRKRGNPYAGRVTKRSRVNGAIGWIYGNGVNRQRIREGLDPDFEAFPRKWGERIKGTPFVEHKGNTYLELKVERVLLDRRVAPQAQARRRAPASRESRYLAGLQLGQHQGHRLRRHHYRRRIINGGWHSGVTPPGSKLQ